jgi:hypothetical protein
LQLSFAGTPAKCAISSLLRRAPDQKKCQEAAGK